MNPAILMASLVCLSGQISPPAPAPTPAHPTGAVGGFFQLDSVWFSQDDANQAAVGDVQDGADFRRARLNVIGKAWDNMSYKFEMDFGFPGRPNFTDVFLDVDDVCGTANLRIGQWKQPFGMEEVTSVKELTFLERGLPFIFTPFRRIGMGLYDGSADGRATWAVSGMRAEADFFGSDVGDGGGWGVAGRATWLPFLVAREDQLLHVGLAYHGADPASDTLRYRAQPEIFAGRDGGAFTPFFVDTGVLPIGDFHVFGGELAGKSGSWMMQSELMRSDIDRTFPVASTLGFTTGYAQLAWVLTGESRPYNQATGVFRAVTPRESFGKEGGRGAWELAARASFMDLDDEDVRGGTLTDFTLGLNWYLNPNAKIQLDYIRAMLDNPTFGEGDADVLAVRSQLVF